MDINEFTDLEIALYPQDKTRYRIEPRLWMTGRDADQRPPWMPDMVITIDPDELDLSATLDDYGKQLTEYLFNDRLRDLFLKGYPVKNDDPPLRVRLFLSPDAYNLRRVKWETLRFPHLPDTLLATSGKVYFSRYQSSQEVNVPHPGSLGRMRALVVIANPDGLSDFGLEPVQVEQELQAAQDSLGNIPFQALCRADLPKRIGNPTLKNLLEQVGKNYDILYLVCHGAAESGDGQPSRIWLEDEDGKMSVVEVSELIRQMQQISYRPRLAVLSSCQSGGAGEEQSSDAGGLAAMGPGLVDIGVPAVVAMQGDVSMLTARMFMKDLFISVSEHGEIDRAVALARANLFNKGRKDWYVPALFMNLRSGRLWYDPGFADPRDANTVWTNLHQAIPKERCVPVIGPGLLEYLTGPYCDLARAWSQDKDTPYPLSEYTRSDLPRVARFLATKLNREYILQRFLDDLQHQIRKRNGDILKNEGKNAELKRLIEVVGKSLRQGEGKDPFWVLAHLSAPIYISATPDNLLFDALVEAGKFPRRSVSLWNDDIVPLDNPFEKNYVPTKEAPLNPQYHPDVDNPLVIYLFGHIEQSASLVLTEDDFFELFVWLMNDSSSGGHLISLDVTTAICTGAMLLVGFQLEDWDSRVLLHCLSRLKQKAKNLPWVAVQVTPDESTFSRPRQARIYLEEYLNKFRNINGKVYWGTAQDFLEKLWERYAEWVKE